ncbi:inositol monophosphatase family protein [Streptomyces sp. NPDC001215]
MINSLEGLDDMGVAIAAACAGADVVRGMYGRRLTRIDKGAGDFATAADVEAERQILDVIRAARPGDGVLGEESGRQGASDAVRQWMVDPLCGTLNYGVGSMLVAVNVALRDGAAAVADPFSGDVFCTDGATAWGRQDGADVRLAPTPATRLVDVTRVWVSWSEPGSQPVDLVWGGIVMALRRSSRSLRGGGCLRADPDADDAGVEVDRPAAGVCLASSSRGHSRRWRSS